MTQLKRIAQWLKSLAAPSITPATEFASALEFDPGTATSKTSSPRLWTPVTT